MALLGLLLGLREAAARLEELAAQAAQFADGPIPRSLDWIAGAQGARRLLAEGNGVLAVAAVLLALALIWRLARRLNPHGRLLAPGAGSEANGHPSAWLRAPLNPGRVGRALLGLALTFYLLGGVRAAFYGTAPEAPLATWGLFALPFLLPNPWLGLLAAFAALGAVLWLLWGEWGVVAPEGAHVSSLAATLARGLLAGAAALPALMPLTSWGRSATDALLAAVGIGDPAMWRLLLVAMVLGLPVTFLALGLVGDALAAPCAGPIARSTLLTAGLFLALLGSGEALFNRTVLEGRYDYGKDLAALIGVPRGHSSTRAYLIFPPEREPLPGLVPHMSIEGIDAGHDSPRRTWEYLKRRQFQCAAAWSAFVHLHDCASLEWDSAESLRVDLANLKHHPEPVFAALLVEKLGTCATSAEHRALLGQAADPSRFRPTPSWLKTLALLHQRFGDPAAARRYLREAGSTEEEIETILGRVPPLTTGRVTGRVAVNGRAGAGLMAGLLPADRWGTLVGTPRPFELRWVGAAARTDSEGRFRIDDVGEGAYVLIVMGDPVRFPLRSADFRVEGRPGLIRLDADHPARDVGTLQITLPEAPEANPTQAASRPSATLAATPRPAQ